MALGLGASCWASDTAEMAADQTGGSQLAFAIANNTTQTRTYGVTFTDTQNHSIVKIVTIPAQTSVAKFLTDIVPASANSAGSMTINRDGDVSFSPPNPGFSVMALRYTGDAFTTITVSCVPDC
jgi:hypothetical protein